MFGVVLLWDLMFIKQVFDKRLLEYTNVTIRKFCGLMHFSGALTYQNPKGH
jgi:uncharacterized membrane protein